MKTKFIFWLDSDFIQFGLAYYLQKNHKSNFYAIIDITNKTKKFFQTQDLIKFDRTWYYFDFIKKNQKNPDLDYLENIEKKYEINLWELALNERIFYRFNHFHKFTTNEILLILEQECKLFESILDDVQPDFFLTKETIQHKDQLFYIMCRKRGVKVIMLGQPKFGYHCMLTERSQKFDSDETLNDIQDEGRSFDELIEYRNSFDVSKQANTSVNKFATSKTEKLKASNQFLFSSDNSNIKTHYTYYGRTKLRVLFHEMVSSFKKKYRKSFVDKHFITEFPKNEKFIYFPLAVDEERNLLIKTPFFTNQFEMIRNIVKSMPVNFKLYVKEAPAQATRRWRSIAEYQEMIDTPNVSMVHPSVSPIELYKKCSLVITISGSSAFEAAFYQKPSIVFADVSYTMLPSVTRIKSIDELSKGITESLKKQVKASDLDKYLKLLEKKSFFFDNFDLQTKEHYHFFYGGHLVDVDVSTSKMKSFLEENKSEFEKLTEEYIKKIIDSEEVTTNDSV